MWSWKAMSEVISYGLYTRYGLRRPPEFFKEWMDGGYRAAMFFDLWWLFTGVKGFTDEGRAIR